MSAVCVSGWLENPEGKVGGLFGGGVLLQVAPCSRCKLALDPGVYVRRFDQQLIAFRLRVAADCSAPLASLPRMACASARLCRAPRHRITLAAVVIVVLSGSCAIEASKDYYKTLGMGRGRWRGNVE